MGAARPFSLHASSNSTANGARLGLARQTGHTLQTFDTSYALDQAYPTRLQPELIHQYEAVSGLWQQWLRMGELERKLHAKQPQDAPTSLDGAAMPPLPPPRRPRGRPRKQQQLQIEAQPVQLAAGGGLVSSQLHPPLM